jgi:hypothetical protein
MRKPWFVSLVIVAALAVTTQMSAQNPTGAGPAQDIPNLSGMWEALGGIARNADNAICGILPLCGGLLGQKPEPIPDTTEIPEMLPWAEAQYKALRGDLAPAANPPEELNPSWNGCIPQGPVQGLQARFTVLELRQFADVVLLLYSADHGVRRVYMDGRGHPPNLQPSWMGHSIGRYEGDALVVDTIGIKTAAWLDVKGHPHTDALRVTERIRRAQPERLEIDVTLDDPQTFQQPWKLKMVKGLQKPGPQMWDSSECEEMLQMGTHYSFESPLKFQKEAGPAITY